jgi:hypothetical protein
LQQAKSQDSLYSTVFFSRATSTSFPFSAFETTGSQSFFTGAQYRSLWRYVLQQLACVLVHFELRTVWFIIFVLFLMLQQRSFGMRFRGLRAGRRLVM